MSAPRTDVEKQKRRHFTPIYATIAIVVLVVIGFVWWLGRETEDPDIPGETGGPVEEVVQPEPAAPQ